MLWTLRELDCPYEVIRLNPAKGETRTKEFLGLNPSGKMPVLVHDDMVLTESLAIMEYLNDTCQAKKLIPSDPERAYGYRKVVHYGLTEIEPYLWLAEQAEHLKARYSWPDGTHEAAITQARKNIKPVWQWLEAGEYIDGGDFSLGDIYFYHLITWANQHGIEYPSEIERYLKLLENRPAFPVEMLSNQEIPEIRP